jgi:hypothetical protein
MPAISTFNNLLVQRKTYLIQHEKCLVHIDSCSILNGSKVYFCQLLNLHQVNDTRQPEIHNNWDIVIWAKCLLRMRWLLRDTHQWVLIKFHQNWYSTFLYDIWRPDWYSIFAHRAVIWLMLNHVSQQFVLVVIVLLLQCFIVMVFCFCIHKKSYLVQPSSRIVWRTWSFGTKSDCWKGLSILQWKSCWCAILISDFYCTVQIVNILPWDF